MLRFRFEKRRERGGWLSLVVLVAAAILSLCACSLMLVILDKPAWTALGLLAQGAFGSLYALEDSVVKAVPIFLCSLGVAVAFRLQVWNIGAEGQFAMGAIGATWAALHFGQQSALIVLPLMLLAAWICGGLWGMIPAVLKLKVRANEIIVTLMFNYLAVLFLDFLVYGPWKDPVSFGFPMTSEFSPSAVVGTIGGTRLNWGLLLCLMAGAAIWVLLRFTRMGFELKASGENVRAARYARLPYEGLVIAAMVISGALAGMAGFLEASATIGRLQPSIMVGYGYTAIVVAWLARLNVLSIALASLLLAGLRVGVENLQLDLQVPAAFGGILEGTMLMAVLAGGFFTEYRLKILSGIDWQPK